MPDIRSKLAKRLKARDKHERCGVVLQSGKVVELTNIHDSPERGFKANPAELVEHITQLAGCWHTHPGRSSRFSEEDYRGFLQWPELTHYIIGTDGVRAYVVKKGAVREVR